MTREEFTKLVTESGWIEKRGKTAKSLSIDRVDPRRGYEAGNVRVLTLAQNSRLRYAPLPGWMKAELEKHESGVDAPFECVNVSLSVAMKLPVKQEYEHER